MALFLTSFFILLVFICLGHCMPIADTQVPNYINSFGTQKTVSAESLFYETDEDYLVSSTGAKVLNKDAIKSTNLVVQYTTRNSTQYKLYKAGIDIQSWLSEQVIFTRPRRESGYTYIHFDDPSSLSGSGHILFLQKMARFSINGNRKDGSADMHLYEVFRMDLRDHVREKIEKSPSIIPVNIDEAEENENSRLDPTEFLFSTLPSPTFADREKFVVSTENYSLSRIRENAPDLVRTTEITPSSNTEDDTASKIIGCRCDFTHASIPTSIPTLTESIVEAPILVEDRNTNSASLDNQNQSDQTTWMDADELATEFQPTTTTGPLTLEEIFDGDVKLIGNDSDPSQTSIVTDITEPIGSNEERDGKSVIGILPSENHTYESGTVVPTDDPRTLPKENEGYLTDSTTVITVRTTLHAETTKLSKTTERPQKIEELEINDDGGAFNFTTYYFPKDYQAPWAPDDFFHYYVDSGDE